MVLPMSTAAASLAGTWGLGKLVCFWDDNKISIDGNTDGWFTDDTPARFEAYGWQVVRNVNGQKNACETDQRDNRRGGRTDTKQAVDDANQQSRSQRDEIDFHDVRPPSLPHAFTKASRSALRMSACVVSIPCGKPS